MNIKIDGKTKVYGLLGNPIEHTKSPFIHNFLAKSLNHNQVYVPFKVAFNCLNEVIQGLYASDIQGLNVTVPFKESVIPYLKNIDEEARLIGAVNTLKRGDNGFIGYNTDVNGLYKALLSDNITINNQDVLIIGAGGAAKAATYLCAREQAKTITILNRTVKKAEDLAKSIQIIFPTISINAISIEDYYKLHNLKYLAIQTTPIGMSPKTNNIIIDDCEFYKQLHTAVDLIYKPSKTLFLQKAEENSAVISNGLKMLIFQAVLAYEIWHDINIDDKIIQSLLSTIEIGD